MASRQSARSSQSLDDIAKADALGKVELETSAQMLKLNAKDARLAFETIPSDILSGPYEQSQINVLAKQIALLKPKEYGKFTRFVFNRLERYYIATLYVTNRVSQLQPREVLAKTIPSLNAAGRVVNKEISLKKSDIPYIRRCYLTALKRSKDLLRATKKTVRVSNPDVLSNIKQPMFGTQVVQQMLQRFQEQIFGSREELRALFPKFKIDQGEDFLAQRLPHLAQGEYIKHTITDIFFILTYRTKIAALEQIDLGTSPEQFRRAVKSMSDEDIQDMAARIDVGRSSFPDDVAQFLRQSVSIRRYKLDSDGKLEKEPNNNVKYLLEKAMDDASRLKAQAAKVKPEEFSFADFNSNIVTRLLYNVSLTDVPDESEFGQVLSEDVYAGAAEFFGVISDVDSEGYEQLKNELIREHEIVKEISSSLRARKEELAKPVASIKAAIDKELEAREQIANGGGRSPSRTRK